MNKNNLLSQCKVTELGQASQEALAMLETFSSLMSRLDQYDEWEKTASREDIDRYSGAVYRIVDEAGSLYFRLLHCGYIE